MKRPVNIYLYVKTETGITTQRVLICVFDSLVLTRTGMGKGENMMLTEYERMYTCITDNMLCDQAFQACP